jgi:hypothetical protein
MTDDSREVFIFHGRGRADIEALAAAIARRYVRELFTEDRLYLLDAGRLVPLSRDILRALVSRAFCSLQLVQVNGRWHCEPAEIELGNQHLADLTAQLQLLAAKAPAAGRVFPDAMKQQWTDRVKMGEPVASIAYAFSVDPSVIKAAVADALPKAWR